MEIEIHHSPWSPSLQHLFDLIVYQIRLEVLIKWMFCMESPEVTRM